MKTKSGILPVLVSLSVAVLSAESGLAQMSTPPADPAELESLYAKSIESRADEILKAVGVSDTAKANAVHDIIINQYRVMRSRDALINAQLEAAGKDINYSNRASQLEVESKILHEYFIARLAKILTPDQIEKLKDKMTYNKVKVTYDAYNNIVPGLTEADKAKMLDLLKAAREKAMDGGSAQEKSDIFQVYKDQINDYLDAHGHDVKKAYKDWEAKQAASQTQAANTAPNGGGK